MPSILSTTQSVYEEDLAEETAEKKIKNQKKSKNQKIKKSKKIKKDKKIIKKKGTSFLFFYFLKLPPKKDAQGNAVYILSALNVFFKRMKHKRLLKVRPPNVRRGRLFIFFQLSVDGWVFMSANFWILESNDNINTLLTIVAVIYNLRLNYKRFIIEDT